MTAHPELAKLVRSSSLHTCLILTSKALSRSGYGDIELLGRRMPKQKSRIGGCELLCHTNLGAQPIRVIVKVIKDSVRTRMLDEMAGAIDRTRSDFGILVPMEELSGRLASVARRYERSRVEVIDIARLTEMLYRFRIGVRPNGEPDYQFFADLDEQLDRVNEFLAHECFP